MKTTGRPEWDRPVALWGGISCPRSSTLSGHPTNPGGVARRVDALIGVRTEVVAQPLGDRRVVPRGPSHVVVGQRACKDRGSHAGLDSSGHDASPGVVVLGELRGDGRGRHQGHQVCIGRVLLADVLEQLGPDDAAVPPDLRAVGDVDVPAELDTAGADLVEALGVGHNLGRPQRLPDVFDERRLVGHLEDAIRAGQVGRRGA